MRFTPSVLTALMAIVLASPALAAPAYKRDKVCPAKDDVGSNLKAQVVEGDKLNCQYEAAGGCVYFLGNGNFSSGGSTCPDAGLDAGDPAAGKIVNGGVAIDQGMAGKYEQPPPPYPMKEEQPKMQEPPMQMEKPKMEEPMMHEPPMQMEKPKEQPPMMHDQPQPPPMHEPPMQQEKPKEEPPMMHEPPMTQPPMMHEPPMQMEKPKEEPPMMHEPPMQMEKPKETSMMMHEPPMTTSSMMMHEPPMTQPPMMPPMQQEKPKETPPPAPAPPSNKPLEDCLHQCKMAMPPSMMGHMRR